MPCVAESFDVDSIDKVEIEEFTKFLKEKYGEIRIWTAPISGHLLIAVIDPDPSENCGWDMYEKAKDMKGYKSTHSPTMWEWNNAVQIQK